MIHTKLRHKIKDKNKKVDHTIIFRTFISKNL